MSVYEGYVITDFHFTGQGPTGYLWEWAYTCWRFNNQWGIFIVFTIDSFLSATYFSLLSQVNMAVVDCLVMHNIRISVL